jgi:trigger factor
VKVTVEKPSSYQRVLKIEVPSQTVNQEMESIYSKVSKTATHPGFRTGKVPRGILEKKLGKSVRLEAVETTVASSTKKALAEQELVPLTDPDFGEVNFEDDGPLSFEATIEVTPDIELADYKGIELKRVKREVTDDDVQSVLERLRVSNAKYTPAERPVEDGDFIVLDFEAFENGAPLKDGKGENFPLEVGSGAFGEDFEEQLVGVAKDEEKRINVTYPEDYRAQELAGKSIEFEVKVKDIKERELPELNDDFAKDLGEHATLDELKQHIRERLEKDMERRIEQFLRDQAMSKIVADSKLEVPPKLKSRVAASIFEDEVNRMAQQGVPRESIAAQQDQLSQHAEREAERQLKVTFVADEIAERENLSISDEELQTSLDEMAKENEEQASRIEEYFKSERVRERYREQLRVRKILDFIVEHAKIEEVEELESESETADEQEGES